MKYMGSRCDDIKLCVGNCHLHIADAVSHVSPKTVATKSLLRISGQKWQLLELFTVRMLEICFRALSQQVHILYKLGGPPVPMFPTKYHLYTNILIRFARYKKNILRIYQKFRIYSYIVRLLSESYKLNAVKIRIEIWINWNWILSPGPGAGSRRRGPVPGSLAQHPSDNSTQSYTCFGQSKTTWTKSGIELGARSSQTFPCFPITVHGVQLLKINIRVSKPLARCLWPSVTNGQWFRAENGKLRSLRGKSGILGRCYLWMRSNVSWRHRKKTVDTVEPVNVVCISGDFTYFHWNNKGQSQRKSLEPLK